MEESNPTRPLQKKLAGQYPGIWGAHRVDMYLTGMYLNRPSKTAGVLYTCIIFPITRSVWTPTLYWDVSFQKFNLVYTNGRVGTQDTCRLSF